MRYEFRISRRIIPLSLVVLTLAGTAGAEIVVFADSAGHSELVDTNNPGAHAMPGGVPHASAKAGGITFNVWYKDLQPSNGKGFNDPTEGDARQARVSEILHYLSMILNYSGSCDILFDASETDGSGPLATGGTFFSTNPGYTNGFAFQHITTGTDPSGSVPDIEVVVDFGYPWYAGAGSPSGSQFDTKTVLIHELTHGLGFLSESSESGSSSIWPNVYSVWDGLLATGNGKDLFGGTPPSFLGVPNDLIGLDNGVRFTGANAAAAFGSNPPVYAPNPFQPGSSLSHWPTGLKIAGNAVMEWRIAPGEVLRAYAPVDAGALQDIGYSMLPAQAPTAAFSATPLIGTPLVVTFTDESTAGSAVITSWLWDFGEGAPSVAQNPTHTYDNPGTYAVSLTVTTDLGTDVETKAVDVFAAGSLPGAGALGLFFIEAACGVVGAFALARRKGVSSKR